MRTEFWWGTFFENFHAEVCRDASHFVSCPTVDFGIYDIQPSDCDNHD